MGEDVQTCYDQLASNYSLMFEDWEASIARQAAAVGAILERECGTPAPLRILDCACGIGTQLLGLAGRGHHLTGCDLSAPAVERAREEARRRGLNIQAQPADMLDLSALPEGDFDAVICLDNALPHIDTRERLLQAAGQILGRLRPGGVFLASIRDYDQLVQERPVVQGPAFLGEGGQRRIVHQIWDWIDQTSYQFHLYITRQNDGVWDSLHYSATYHAWSRADISGVLLDAGFREIRWMDPKESGFYQPVVMARRP